MDRAISRVAGSALRRTRLVGTGERDQRHVGREELLNAEVVSHGRYVTFQMAEVAIPRQLFAEIMQRIAALRSPPMATATEHPGDCACRSNDGRVASF